MKALKQVGKWLVRDLEDGYYHVVKDIIMYPMAIFYIVWSMRGPGKTYSFLEFCKDNNVKFAYMKRTNEDVAFICSGGTNKLLRFDPSPFAPLNRDHGWNIQPKLIDKGIGAFYDESDPEEDKEPLGYILSLNKVKSIKGIDLSTCDFICLDEFIPQTHEIVRRTEGQALLDLYMTISRDREFRGREPLKMVLFANSENIATPITHTLEIVDDMAELAQADFGIKYIEERGILMHHIKINEYPVAMKQAQESGISKVMKGTKWERKALYGEFANNDFTSVYASSIKKTKCVYKVIYGTKEIYIYLKENGSYYFSRSRSEKYINSYDLNREADQNLFWVDVGQEMMVDWMEGRVSFQDYSMCDMLVNYKEIFKIK